MDSLPVWTLSLTDAVHKARTLIDLDVWPIQTIRLLARCSWHGKQELIVQTTEQLTDHLISGYLLCRSCGAQGVDRFCPIEDYGLVK